MPDTSFDWVAIERSPAFQRLTRSRKRFVFPAMAFIVAVFVTALCLFAYAPEAMSEPAVGSITWALIVGATLVVFTFAMALVYARKAREWSRLAEDVRAEVRDR